MSRSRNPIAKIVVIGPSGARLKDTHYEYHHWDGPISELELYIAILLGKNNFTVEELIHVAWWNFLLRQVHFNKIRRPHEIIKRYGSRDAGIHVDLSKFNKARSEHEQVMLDIKRWDV